jgi:hypothetical protein
MTPANAIQPGSMGPIRDFMEGGQSWPGVPSGDAFQAAEPLEARLRAIWPALQFVGLIGALRLFCKLTKHLFLIS